MKSRVERSSGFDCSSDCLHILQQPEVKSILNQFGQVLFARQKPRIEEFLSIRDDYRVAVLEELLRIEIEFRCAEGETVSIDEYLLRFPELAKDAEYLERLQIAQQRFAATDIHDRETNSEASRPDQSGSDSDSDEKVHEFIGRYQVERIIGRGSFGQVYLAFDEKLSRHVAVKVPHADRMSGTEDAKMYLDEARTVANLHHPQIVPVYDVGSSDQFPFYIVSRFIQGTDLATRLSKGRLAITDTLELVITIAEALHYAHRQGVVHRDVKPANILIDTEGSPFVVDFGLALKDHSPSNRGQFAGTPAYMSPEQARSEGHRVDGRSDIFSLGVVLYEAVVGRRPFRGSTIDELIEQITTWEPKPPRQVDDRIPKDLERICLKALAKNFSDRYTTARDLADDLRQILNQSAQGGSSNQAIFNLSPDSPPAVVSPPQSSATDVTVSADSHASNEGSKLPRSGIEGSGRGSSSSQRNRIGEFEILGKLGQGGMGVVYRAWQPSLRRQVALKTLLLGDNVKHQQRFSREIRALGPVRDPHLAEVFASGIDGDIFYYVMELIEGITLDVVCEQLQSKGSTASDIELKSWKAAVSTICGQKRQALSEDQESSGATISKSSAIQPSIEINIPAGRNYVQHVAELVRQVSEAAHKLHQAGAIHRDIKPANIMVGATGTDAVLIDLGLAQLADETDRGLSRTREFVGTLRYASPEQVLAVGPLDGRSDVYSLGATLWELLTLRPMHNADNSTPIPELMRRIEFGDPDPVVKYNKRVPRDLQAIVMKALEKNPEHRYQTALDFAADLRRFLASEAVKARPVGWGRRALRQLWRARTESKILMLAVVLALPILVFVSFGNSQRDRILHFRNQVSSSIDRLDARPEDWREVNDLLNEMSREFPEPAQALRVQFASAFASQLEKKVRYTLAFRPQDIGEINESLELLNKDLPGKAKEIRELIEKYNESVVSLVELKSPFENYQQILDSKIELDVDRRFLIQRSDDPFVKTKIDTEGDFEIEVTFAEMASVGIVPDVVMAGQSDGYFVSFLEAGSGLNAARQRLQIGTQVADQREVLRERILDLPAGPLKLSVRRTKGELFAQVNDCSPPVTYLDLFSRSSSKSGTIGLIWPKGTRVERIRVWKQSAEKRDPMVAGDTLYTERRYAEAIAAYDSLLQLASNEKLRQEILYKKARCHIMLNERETAVTILTGLASENGDRWPLLAACEWCIELLKANKWDDAQTPLTRLVEFSPEPKSSGMLFERMYSELFPRYFRTSAGSRTATIDKELIQRLVQMFKIVERQSSDLPRSRRLEAANKMLTACLFINLDNEAEHLILRMLEVDGRNGAAPDEASMERSAWLNREYSLLLIRNHRMRDSLDHIRQMQNDPGLPEVIKTGLLLEQSRSLAALGSKEDARHSLEEFFGRANSRGEESRLPASNQNTRFTIFDVQIADAWILKGFLAETPAESVAIWKEGYHLLRTSSNLKNISITLLSSLSRELTKEEANTMIKLVAGENTEPFSKVLDMGIIDADEYYGALRDMWFNLRGREYARKSSFGEISQRDLVAMQIPLSFYEVFRKGAFGDIVTDELDEILWHTLNDKLFEAYRKKQFNLFDAMFLLRSWHGDLGFGGWGTLGGRFDSIDRSLRSPMAYFFGCRMLRYGHRDKAKVFLEDAARNITETHDGTLAGLIDQELKKLSK